MITKEDISLLDAISIKSGVELEKLVDEYSDKTTDYCLRDHRNGKHVKFFEAKPQRERAINVIYNTYITKYPLYKRLEEIKNSK